MGEDSGSVLKTSIIPKLENGGVTLNWKVIGAIAVVLLGGGGGTVAWRFATEQYVDESIVEQAQDAEVKQAARDEALDATLEHHEEQLDKHGQVIGEVRIDISEIQQVQHQQFARDEARRVTKDIGPRARREEAYDRMVDLNLSRLRNGKPPCTNLDCSN